MMPSRLRNKLLFVTAVMSLLFTLCLPSYSPASNYAYDNSNRLIRVDYQDGSNIVYTYDESGDRTQSLTTSIAATSLQVTVESDAQHTLPGINLYLFDDAGTYQNLTQVTNASGGATFAVPAGNYKVRADYLGYQFWSAIVNFPATANLTLVIPMSTVVVNVGAAYGVATGVPVYLFTIDGSYLGISAVTDASGNVTFTLPVGYRYMVRADIMDGQYWSDIILVAGGGTNNVAVAAGGGVLQANILQAPGVPLTNVNAYLFSDSGAYLGMSQVSDAAGVVSFAVPQGNYKIRADYLGYQFWSNTNFVAANVTIDFLIPHKNVNITVGGVFQGAFTPLGGINVYLFNTAGSYLGKTLQTDATGKAVFSVPQKAYQVRADYLGQQYWSAAFTWTDMVVNIPLANAVITVTGSAMPYVSVPVYVFTQDGSYLGVTGQTGADGKITFRLPAGTYKFRADYQGNQFWSENQTLIADQSLNVNISAGGGNFTLTVNANANPVAGVNCYVFNDTGAYLGITGTTDANGNVLFSMANGNYKFRVDYLGYQFWSGVTNVPAKLNLTMVIPMSTVVVNVGAAYGAISGVNVYLFTIDGSYLGISAVTDDSGNVTFTLPVGSRYMVRADIMDSQYWSDIILVAGGGTNNVVVNAGGGTLQVNILKAAGVPLTGVTAYLFDQNGSYLGLSQTADATGKVAFNVPSGTYNVRVDYLGYQFWCSNNVVTSDMVTNFIIPHQDVTITVGGLYQGAFTPMANVNVYLFNDTGSYIGMMFTTDATGSGVFNLPQKAYQVRADYLGQQYWSEAFTWVDKAVNIPMADVAITMIGAGMPQAGVPVYVFNSANSYLGVTANTGADGKVTLRIPAGTYKFRADYQGNQFWTDYQTIVADQINNISLSDGGGNFTLTVKANADPLAGVNCYAFNSSGAYLGLSGVTNGNGQYIFALSTGNYKIRVDYMGYQFWTDVYSVPTQLAADFTIELSATPVTVSAFYLNSMPLSGLNVYLFTQAGAYVNISNVTDANGGVVFSIPNKDYKIRIDYLGRQFWANLVAGQSSPVVINEGLATMYAHNAAGPVVGATVYLFSESGDYLGMNAATDAAGNARFTLPAYPFKFRVDVTGVQYWSQVITIVEGVESVVDVSAE